MKKCYAVCFLFVFVICSCKKDKPIIDPPVTGPDTAAFTSVVLKADKNPGKLTADITCTVTGSEITALIPSMENNKQLVVTFTTKAEGTVVKVNDTVIVSGTTATNFAKPVTYVVTTPKGSTKNYTFKVKNYTGIPIFYITTASPVVSKDDYVTGKLVINTNNEYEQETNNIALQIKGRGNTTWGMPKKPYRLKFDSKAAVLGLPAAKNWVLLANYADKSLMRTSLAFKLGDIVGADFNHHAIPVEVVMNGEYLGSYVLTEQVEVHENRVNIPEMEQSDITPDKITGGYLLEFDGRLDEEFWFKTTRGAPLTLKSPEDTAPEQLAYISKYFQDFEDVLFSENFKDPENGYAKYINTESFIEWYIVQELFKNNDANLASSIFYYKDRGGKLNMGPLWDFDIAGGNINYNGNDNPTGWWIRSKGYFQRLFEDPAFNAKFVAKWNELKAGGMVQMFEYMNKQRAYLNLSQEKNFQKWDILNTWVWPNAVVTGSYAKEVDYLQNWLTLRFNWIDANK